MDVNDTQLLRSIDVNEESEKANVFMVVSSEPSSNVTEPKVVLSKAWSEMTSTEVGIDMDSILRPLNALLPISFTPSHMATACGKLWGTEYMLNDPSLSFA